MKTIFTLTVVLALFVVLPGPGAWAQKNNQGGEGRGQRGPANNAQDRPQRAGPQNGQRGQNRAGQGPAEQAPRGQAEDLFRRFDRNSDGFISAAEIPGNARQRLAQMDTNGDGGCDRGEFLAARNNQQRPGPPQANIQALMDRFDANGDGVISIDEVPAEGRQRLVQMDANGDGGCDRTELNEGMQRQGAANGQRGQGPSQSGQGQRGQDRQRRGDGQSGNRRQSGRQSSRGGPGNRSGQTNRGGGGGQRRGGR